MCFGLYDVSLIYEVFLTLVRLFTRAFFYSVRFEILLLNWYYISQFCQMSDYFFELLACLLCSCRKGKKILRHFHFLSERNTGRLQHLPEQCKVVWVLNPHGESEVSSSFSEHTMFSTRALWCDIIPCWWHWDYRIYPQ